jgi:type I phosphodiesterase/nucleotide pyrophosphatase
VLIGRILRELAVQSLLVDVSRGTPAMYVDFIGYDETAHRRGPDAPASMRHLSSADAALATLFAAAEAAPELGYDVYVFSDHGHVATRPFESLEGLSLPEYVGLAAAPSAAASRTGSRPRRRATSPTSTSSATTGRSRSRACAPATAASPPRCARARRWASWACAVAYAWEFGSHGGIAPEELDCFVACPRSCPFRFASVVRPSELYRFFERTYRAPAEAEPEDDEPVRRTPEPLRAGPELESPPP